MIMEYETKSISDFQSAQTQHGKMLRLLMQRSPDRSDPFWEDIAKFTRDVETLGKMIYSLRERQSAQAMLNYWSSHLIGKDLETPISLPLLLKESDLSKAPDLSEIASPYKGLEAFGRHDTQMFFARENFTTELIDLAMKPGVSIVTGPSGSGKSSVLFGAVIPSLEAMNPEADIITVPSLSINPVRNLLDAIFEHLDADFDAKVEKRVSKNPKNIKQIFEGMNKPIVVVDQLEELFTLCDNQERRGAFINAITHLSEKCHIFAVLRSDFLNRLIILFADQGLGVDDNMIIRPPRLTKAELKDIILKPAQKVGLEFDDKIIDNMVNQVAGDESALPLLQFALSRLWEKKTQNRITQNAYQEVGTPYEALAKVAEEIYFSYSPETQNSARDVFKLMVRTDSESEIAGYVNTFDEYVRQRVTRGIIYSKANADRAEKVLADFVDAGLLKFRKGKSPELDVFEVSHEALIRNWARLSQWLEESRVEFRKRNHYLAAAELWANEGQRKNLLLSDWRLEEAEQFSGISPNFDVFLKESKTLKARKGYKLATILGCLLAITASGWGWATLKILDLRTSKGSLITANETILAEIASTNMRLEDTRIYLERTDENYIRLNSIIKYLLQSERPRNDAEWRRVKIGIETAIAEWEDNQKKFRAEAGLSKRELSQDIRTYELKEFTQSEDVKLDSSESRSEVLPDNSDRVSLISDEKHKQSGDQTFDCTGAMWLGNQETKWTVGTADGGTFDPELTAENDKLIVRDFVKLRDGFPDAENNSKPRISTLIPGTEIEVTGPIKSIDRPAGIQYWAPIKTHGPACFTIYVQISDEKQLEDAKTLREKIQSSYGYFVPEVEVVDFKFKTSEIRYSDNEYQAVVNQLEEDVSVLLSDEGAHGFRPLSNSQILNLEGQNNTLELWLASFEVKKPNVPEEIKIPPTVNRELETEPETELPIVRPVVKPIWSDWWNQEIFKNPSDPSENGDYNYIEIFKQLSEDKSLNCEVPQEIECRRISDKVDWRSTEYFMSCDVKDGSFCLDSKQEDERSCPDFEIRVLCSAKP